MFDCFRNTVYVRIKPDWMSVLHVESGREYGDVPTLAIERKKDGKRSIVAVGRDAATKAGLSTNIIVANGFSHPRTLLADFIVAEQTLRYFLKMVMPKSLFAPSPIAVIHPLVALDGGLTQIEIRAFAELGHGAGARKVFLWEGPELSKEELNELQFSRADGRLLNP